MGRIPIVELDDPFEPRSRHGEFSDRFRAQQKDRSGGPRDGVRRGRTHARTWRRGPATCFRLAGRRGWFTAQARVHRDGQCQLGRDSFGCQATRTGAATELGKSIVCNLQRHESLCRRPRESPPRQNGTRCLGPWRSRAALGGLPIKLDQHVRRDTRRTGDADPQGIGDPDQGSGVELRHQCKRLRG